VNANFHEQKKITNSSEDFFLVRRGGVCVRKEQDHTSLDDWGTSQIQQFQYAPIQLSDFRILCTLTVHCLQQIILWLVEWFAWVARWAWVVWVWCWDGWMVKDKFHIPFAGIFQMGWGIPSPPLRPWWIQSRWYPKCCRTDIFYNCTCVIIGSTFFFEGKVGILACRYFQGSPPFKVAE